MRRLRIAFGVSLGCVLALLLGLVVQGYRRAAPGVPTLPAASAGDPQASLSLHGVHLTETAGDETRWDLRAAEGEFFKDRQVTLLRDVEVTFFTRDGRTLTLRGDAGRLATDTKDIALSGNVVATSSDGYRVTTEALEYSNGERTVRGDGPVQMVGEAVDVSGIGVTIRVEEQTVSIPQQVSSVVRQLEPAGRPGRRGGARPAGDGRADGRTSLDARASR